MMPILDLIDFSNYVHLLTGFLFLSMVIFLRYVLVCLVLEVVFNRLLLKKYNKRKVNTRLSIKPGQRKKEIYWSMVSSLIFAAFFMILIYYWQQGYTKIYAELRPLDIVYLPVSIFIYLFIQDGYYYILHRWMHHPKVYRKVHRVHHQSVVATPWTSFSFHPLETLLQAITLPILVFIVPIHWAALLALLIIMTVAAVINHLNIEVYPRWLLKHPVGKYLIGATHHSHHHSRFNYNYGLYFSFWDHWLGTELLD